MNLKSNRGILPVIYLTYLLYGVAAGGVAYLGYKVFQPGRDKNQVHQAAAAADTAKAQADTNNAVATALTSADQKVQADKKAYIATRDACDQNAAGGIAASTEALKSDLTPSQAELVALGFNDLAAQSLDSLPPAQLAKVKALVAGVLKHDAAATAERDRWQADAVATHAKLADVSTAYAASSQHETQLVTQNAAGAAREVKLTATTSSLTHKVQEWADTSGSLLDRLHYAGYLIALLSVILVWYEIKRKGLTGALGDAVALVGYVKNEAVAAGHDAGALETKIHNWFEGDAKSEAALKKVQTTVLRQ